MKTSKALFLDRDGTIIKEIPGEDSSSYGYITKPEQVELITGAAEGIAIARELGFKIIIVTNQSAIARGWLSLEKFHEINSTAFGLLRKENTNALIDDLLYSPYHKDGIVEGLNIEHHTRKPGTGMVLEAEQKYNLNLSESYMIGDAYTDMLCGQNAGMKNILVMTGYGKVAYQKCLDEKIKINFIADNLLDAAKYLKKISTDEQRND